MATPDETLAVAVGPSVADRLDDTIGVYLARTVQRLPKHGAIVVVHDGHSGISREFGERAIRPSSATCAAGLSVGDRVGLCTLDYSVMLGYWNDPERTVDAFDADQGRKFCRGKIAHHKVPRCVPIVDESPTTLTGKVRTVDMSDTSFADLGLTAETAS